MSFRSRQRRGSKFLANYTQGLKADDLPRLFTRDTREAYQFFARHIDERQMASLRWPRRLIHRIALFFMAFSMKLSPARRILFASALAFAVLGLVRLSGPRGLPDGTQALFLAFLLVNLLVLLEVADRLSLKNDLEVARDIQLAMQPHGLHRTAEVETVGMSRPANTVGGDFFDVLALSDGRLVVAVGDVAGKGSPAALLMALLMAMLRTLVEAMQEEPGNISTLLARLNVQVSRHAPTNRFITLFLGIYDPRTHTLEYINAGHTPPILLKADGSHERLLTGGVALGLFEHSTFAAASTSLGSTDILTMYSDGISEAENPRGEPFDEDGLLAALTLAREHDLSTIVSSIVRAVEMHRADDRFADDLTLLLLRRIQ